MFSPLFDKKKSGLRANIETRKQLHAVFVLTVEQHGLRRNVAIVQSYSREPLLILTSLNDHMTSRESMYSLKHEQHYVPLVNNIVFCKCTEN